MYISKFAGQRHYVQIGNSYFRGQRGGHFKVPAYVHIMLKVKKHWSYATMKDQALQLDTVPVLNCLKRTKEQPANANIFNRQSAVAA
jgi:hypothetical protein